MRVNLDLFYDYRTNVALYGEWQKFLRDRQPKTLIFWGQDDVLATLEQVMAEVVAERDALRTKLALAEKVEGMWLGVELTGISEGRTTVRFERPMVEVDGARAAVLAIVKGEQE